MSSLREAQLAWDNQEDTGWYLESEESEEINDFDKFEDDVDSEMYLDAIFPY